ncbi:uncharacterized protein BP01DRAFT_387434 [Aspergillus saccharolyticus JOP 1030-1]|uniref:Uncharacterized protein n=1 Tax=Aspergillus saccharolyticus JOP 1030-1 TaxID=1450539 RepID=A0A318Z222_9EURO|nr:hypothetical protein BP01DRAFT_387434 [Aspergillus saccharolyticus JOP 1030-1]PYH40327.1 hypothetical protein BP01DRAFT_387434 [Aspergillus saccharolyticus JOP 1030-1]
MGISTAITITTTTTGIATTESSATRIKAQSQPQLAAVMASYHTTLHLDSKRALATMVSALHLGTRSSDDSSSSDDEKPVSNFLNYQCLYFETTSIPKYMNDQQYLITIAMWAEQCSVAECSPPNQGCSRRSEPGSDPAAEAMPEAVSIIRGSMETSSLADPYLFMTEVDAAGANRANTFLNPTPKI